MSKQHSDDLKCEWIGEREKERNKGRAKKIQCKERKNNKKKGKIQQRPWLEILQIQR